MQSYISIQSCLKPLYGYSNGLTPQAGVLTMNRCYKLLIAPFLLLICGHVPVWGSSELTPVAPVKEQRVAQIELTQGFSITAFILRERPEDLILDLGFAVLRVPKDYVLQVREAGERLNSNDEGSDIYRVSDGPSVRPVNELASELGGSVVMVRTPTGLGSGFIIDPRGYGRRGPQTRPRREGLRPPHQ